MNVLIEKLKDPDYVRAFGLMKPEERECYKKVGAKNCLVYDGHSGWIQLMAEINPWCKKDTILIKPDYQPQPESKDIPIKLCGGWLGICQNNDGEDCGVTLPHYFTHIHALPSLPGFRGFWYDEKAKRLFGDFAYMNLHAVDGE